MAEARPCLLFLLLQVHRMLQQEWLDTQVNLLIACRPAKGLFQKKLTYRVFPIERLKFYSTDPSGLRCFRNR